MLESNFSPVSKQRVSKASKHPSYQKMGRRDPQGR